MGKWLAINSIRPLKITLRRIWWWWEIFRVASSPLSVDIIYVNLLQSPIEFNSGSIKAFNNVNIEKTAIERDVKTGRPIRRGYIPVEEKIQSELRDLKSRECELKKLHKLRDSDEEYSGDEFNNDWTPINGKLSRSIDVLNGSSLSPRWETTKKILFQQKNVLWFYLKTIFISNIQVYMLKTLKEMQ